MNQSPYILIENEGSGRVIIAARICDGVGYASRGAEVVRFRNMISFKRPGGIVEARDAAMKWIRIETDRHAARRGQREAGSRTP